MGREAREPGSFTGHQKLFNLPEDARAQTMSTLSIFGPG